MKFIIVCLLFASVALAARSAEEWKSSFADFMIKYNKHYESNAEIQKRFAAFQENMLKADELNKKNPSAKYGATKFADLTSEEFASKYLMPNFQGTKEAAERFPPASIELPKNYELPVSFDWNSKGAVTPVYNQEQCGSCWAFSATEAIESQWFLSTNKLISLSPQQIVDCDIGGEDEGCNGGDTTTAYEYVIKAGGMETWSDYPYVGEDQTCEFSSSKVVAKIANWTYITTNKNETEMQVGLLERGPLSICVDASSWQVYIGGVVSDLCGEDLDHCVMITGFNDYSDIFGTYHIWNIRNSWGEDWGENGYIWVERGYDLCGVADEVTIPLVN